MAEVTSAQQITIGKPIANTSIWIMDHMNRLLPIGMYGELCIAGDGLARGYLNRPDLTAEKFIMHPLIAGERMYRTGDLARWDVDGNIEYIGRIDDQVKIRGYRMELGEIEACLLGHASIREGIVMVLEDAEGQKKLCAYIVANEPIPSMELRAYLSQQLPSYMLPSYWVQLEQLPLTSNGKVDRKALPQPQEEMGSDASYNAPRNEVEWKLAGIWQDVLGVELIGLADHFFDRGGHSLKAMNLLSRIHQEFAVEVSVSTLFATPTLQEIAAAITTGMESTLAVESNYAPIVAVAPQAYYPVSSAQRRLFILQQLEEAGTAYNMPSVLLLEGSLDRGRLERAFHGLIQRHEILRTSFEMVGGEPVQRVHETLDLELHYMEAEEDAVQSLATRFVRPFALNEAPLIRAGVIQRSSEQHVLLFDMHHIISDGVTMGVIVQEFMDLYANKSLPPLRTQYKDYAVWQQGIKQSESMQQQEAYWLRVLGGEMPVLNMPLDYARPTVQQFAGDQVSFQLDKAMTARLKQVAAGSGSTLYMVLLAVYNVMLHKYTGQEDIVVGSRIAARSHAELERMVGMFVNTLAMRNRPEGHKSFAAFLQEVKEHALAAYANQAYPFEELVEKVQLYRDRGRNPLFDTMFVLQNMELPTLALEDLRVTPYAWENSIAKFDLTLTAVDGEEGLLFRMEYGTKLWKAETIEENGRAFRPHYRRGGS